MDDKQRPGREVRIFTEGGVIEGRLNSGAMRTLDELNLSGRQFVSLEEPRALEGAWPFENAPLSLNRDAVVMVVEVGPPPPQASGRYGRFSRMPVQLRTRELLIQGFVHVLPGGVAMKRFDHDHHAFVALTTAVIQGHKGEIAVPFAAVNRRHVIAAQSLGSAEASATTLAGSFSAI